MSSATTTWLAIIVSLLTLLIFFSAPGPWRQGILPESREKETPGSVFCPIPAASAFSGQAAELPEGGLPNMDVRLSVPGKVLQTATFSLG